MLVKMPLLFIPLILPFVGKQWMFFLVIIYGTNHFKHFLDGNVAINE